ncbi:biopolymer transporter ExbD [Luteimonas aestuarii]|uniref:Biopolymer transporter ExbD n=1 Tax=Luteimonas aestuarii TaxID=453837 RepID=A0A4R5TIR9_9GAMM|nr:biopolymer transporter ExbD [Luteimonas aestuarii]TDK19048.1 biopolymer transporter ExbD [Luteimonas aestuarii]
MAFSDSVPRGQAIAEINIIPLCDVLLVLLIIFMVTAPALSYPVNVDLPGSTDRQQTRDPPMPIHLRIDAGGQVYWDGQAVSRNELAARMQAQAARVVAEQPLLKIDASGDCEYQAVARVVAQARNAGMAKIGFVRQ